jgi:uncharacterized protein (DUF2147 family)
MLMRKMWVVAASVAMLMADRVGADGGGPSIIGDWGRSDGALHINISPCGEKLCAVNTWTRDPASGDRVGDRLVLSLNPREASTLTGEAFDQRRRLTYSLRISVDRDAMTTRGCLLAGLACRTMSWNRQR